MAKYRHKQLSKPLEKIKLNESDILSEKSSGLVLNSKVFNLRSSSSQIDQKDMDERPSENDSSAADRKNEETALQGHLMIMQNFVATHKAI